MVEGVDIVTAGIGDNIELIIIGVLIVLFDIILPILKKKRKQNQPEEPLPDLEIEVEEEPTVESPPPWSKPTGTWSKPTSDRSFQTDRAPQRGSGTQPTAGRRRPSPEDFTLGGRPSRTPKPYASSQRPPKPSPDPVPMDDPMAVLRKYEEMRRAREKRVQSRPSVTTESIISRAYRNQLPYLFKPLTAYEGWQEAMRTEEFRKSLSRTPADAHFPWSIADAFQSLGLVAYKTVEGVQEEVLSNTGAHEVKTEFDSVEDLAKHPERLIVAMLPSILGDAMGLMLGGAQYARIRITSLIQRDRINHFEIPLNTQGESFISPPLSVISKALLEGMHAMGYMREVDETNRLLAGILESNQTTHIRLTGLARPIEISVDTSTMASAAANSMQYIIRARYESLQSQSLGDFTRRHSIVAAVKESVQACKKLPTVGIHDQPGAMDLWSLAGYMALARVTSLAEAIQALPVRRQEDSLDDSRVPWLDFSLNAVAEGVVLREILRRPGEAGRI